jgi:hypothetical protein
MHHLHLRYWLHTLAVLVGWLTAKASNGEGYTPMFDTRRDSTLRVVSAAG